MAFSVWEYSNEQGPSSHGVWRPTVIKQISICQESLCAIEKNKTSQRDREYLVVYKRASLPRADRKGFSNIFVQRLTLGK